MKLNFNLKNKEASVEADIEKLIDKNMDIKSNKQPKKTRYQIEQEEKRKNIELEKKQKIKEMFIFIGMMMGIVIFIMIICIIGKTFLE